MNEKQNQLLALLTFFVVLALSSRIFEAWGVAVTAGVFILIRFAALPIGVVAAERKQWQVSRPHGFATLIFFDRWFRITTASMRTALTGTWHWLRVQPWDKHLAKARSTARQTQQFAKERRRLSLSLAAATVILFMGGVWLLSQKRTAEAPPPAVPPRPTTSVSTGDLAGRTAANLYATYIGVSDGSRIPSQLIFDPSRQLGVMWQNKFNWIQRHNMPISPVVRQASRDLQDRYNRGPITYLTLNQFVDLIEQTIDAVKDDIDWAKLARVEKIADAQRARLLERICRSINGNDILAYGMTELMPSADGKLNVAVMSFLLQHAGSEYLESIPAQYDAKCSFGIFQFTEFALCHLERDGKVDCRGASVVNHARLHPIPDSVINVRGMQHFEAGYQFMVDNIARLISKASKKQFAVLETAWRKHKDEVVVFGATAHHRPQPARSAARRWLDNKMNKHYLVSCPGVLRAYGQKTQGNLAALRDDEVMKNRLVRDLVVATQ